MVEVKQTDEATLYYEPETDDESTLVGMLFERVTEIYPEWPMGDRTDLAMSMLAVVKRWAHNLELTSESAKVLDVNE